MKMPFNADYMTYANRFPQMTPDVTRAAPVEALIIVRCINCVTSHVLHGKSHKTDPSFVAVWLSSSPNEPVSAP